MRSERCARVLSTLMLAACLALEASLAWSQMRLLPVNARRAELTGYQNPVVIVGGEARRLAPGALIFDTNNRTITPGFLPAKADVLYTVDQTGAVMRIYLLTPQEIQRLDAAKR